MLRARDSLIPLKPGRVHEACGPGAWVFAAVQAGRAGTVVWCQERWQSDGLHPLGLLPFCDPSRVLLMRPARHLELLAVAEEVLRDGSVPMVIMLLTEALGLTEGRRLQLAAQAGRSTGLCLIAEGAGSHAAESRWRCTPVFDENGAEDSTLHHWDLIKNKSGTFGDWYVRWDRNARRVVVVSPAFE